MAKDELWEKLMEKGRKMEKREEGIAHSMTEEQQRRIFGTIDYSIPMGVPNPMALNKQWYFDMNVAKYRLFDEIGMALDGRLGEDEDTKRWAREVAKAYINCAEQKDVNTRSELYNCIPDEMFK